MSKLCNEMLRDIDKDTVNLDPNFDESRKEPRVLPSRFPNLLVNGSSGIAVGMATNIPPHNLREVIDACVCILENPEADLLDLMEHIQGPDFPTRGIIMGRSGIRAAYSTGRGKITVRARTELEEFGPEPPAHHRHRASLSGQQTPAHCRHGRPGARQAPRGHLRYPRRNRPQRHAYRH